MNKIYKKSLYMLVVGALAVSCADYNVTDDFKAEADPSFTTPYADLDAVKSYIDRTANPNLKIGATLDITEFNKQELAHSAAIANFDNVSFGTSLMSGKIISETGVMNFIALNDLLEHMDEIGGEVFGSPIVANANQAGKWIKTLTAPIEIPVNDEVLKTINYNDYEVGTHETSTGTIEIKKYDKQNTLYLKQMKKVNIVDDFELEEGATYTTTFYANCDKDASFFVYFSGTKIDGTATKDGKWQVPAKKWTKVVVPAETPADVTDGYLMIEMMPGSNMYVNTVEVVLTPDNHRPQTDQERSDTIKYALNAWCDGFMKINKGRIKSFDLIDEPIDNIVELENGMYDIKHDPNHTAKMDQGEVFWQDYLGSENYAPAVAKVAREAYAKYEGNPDELKFFISESGLEDAQKMESLKYWIRVWDNNGAKIDGITAKLNLVCYEDAAKQAEVKASYEALLSSLAATGKLVRVSNLDVKYVDANNASVAPANITAEQRQTLADFNAYAIKAYMNKIPSDKQAGIVKSNLVDTSSEPVGLWLKDAKNGNDWTRTATYKAWCDALSEK